MTSVVHPVLRSVLMVSLVMGCLLFAAIPSFAQFGSASVLGYVRDNTGAMVPGATVTLTAFPSRQLQFAVKILF